MRRIRHGHTLATRVFDLAASRGFRTELELARAMGISPGYVGRIRTGRSAVSALFVAGALHAFPGMTFDDLFYVEREPADAEKATA